MYIGFYVVKQLLWQGNWSWHIILLHKCLQYISSRQIFLLLFWEPDTLCLLSFIESKAKYCLLYVKKNANFLSMWLTNYFFSLMDTLCKMVPQWGSPMQLQLPKGRLCSHIRFSSKFAVSSPSMTYQAFFIWVTMSNTTTRSFPLFDMNLR